MIFLPLLATLLLLLCPTAAASDIQETIDCVKAYIEKFKNKMEPQLFAIFEKSFPNTLETTIQHYNLTPG